MSRRPLAMVLTALLTATALTVVAVLVLAPRPAHLDPARSGDTALADRAVAAIGSQRLNGLSVAVVGSGDGGPTVTTGAAGLARGDGAPVTEATSFETGSVMKPITGHLLADLVDAGVSSTAQAVLFLTVGTLNTAWGTVPVPLWWLAVWLLSLGVVVLVLRWPGLPPTGPRPRRERAGAAVWVLLAGALLTIV